LNGIFEKPFNPYRHGDLSAGNYRRDWEFEQEDGENGRATELSVPLFSPAKNLPHSIDFAEEKRTIVAPVRSHVAPAPFLS